MERIFRKKRKPRVSTSKVIYFVAIFSFLILIALSLVEYSERKNKEVVIKKIEFEHFGEETYVKFRIDNPSNENKTCSLTINIADKKYAGYANISAKSSGDYKTKINMPSGKTEVILDYICS